MSTYSIVLSAGKGTRMGQDAPKVLQPVLDKPMINIILEQLNQINVEKNFLIVGYKKEKVIEEVSKNFKNVSFCEQIEQLGTGDAVKQAKQKMQHLTGTTVITCGDTPLITSNMFEKVISYHQEEQNDLTILSTELKNPFGYGRIIRDINGEVVKIKEQKDANEEEKTIREINSGVYVVNNQLLFKYIEQIDNQNSQKEYYLTDIVDLFLKDDLKVGAYKTQRSQNLIGVNTLENLSYVNNILKIAINKKFLKQGVNIIDPLNTYIGLDVKIGKGTIIYPGNYITGKTTIGENNVLKPNNYIDNSKIKSNNEIGPMAHIRGESEIYNHTRIGNFVEIKNTKFQNNSKTAHLTYLGDSEIGEYTNIGCGVITANYDGKNKYKTHIGANSFIGSNVTLIAPVSIDNDVFIAAGTTVTTDIPKSKFVIGRAKECIKNKK